VGLDCDATRLQRVRDNLARLHLTATLIKGDASQPNTWWDGVLFDRILLDAPCSALGVIRRHPDIKWLRTPAEIVQVVNTQAQLLRALWPLLAPGGRLVYATCSIMPTENEQQLAAFIAQHTNARNPTQPTPNWGRPTGHGWQILPGEEDMDGFFYGILEKLSA
jgi:16S rRNA (cytosine967-C5)-methyltransferase